MEIKNVDPLKVFGKEIKTSLKTISKHVKVLPDKVLSEMKQKGFLPSGPQVWIYKGADGYPETEFDLMVGFSVSMASMDHSITAFDEFKCATIIHKGDWAKFSETYNLIIGEIMQTSYEMTGESREIYHQVDFENVENNLTEIQIGIK